MTKRIITLVLLLLPGVALADIEDHTRAMQSGSGTFLPLAGGSMTGDIAMAGNKLKLDSDGNSYLYSAADNEVNLFMNGVAALKHSSGYLILQSARLYFNGTSDPSFQWSSAQDQMVFSTGTNYGMQLVLTTVANATKDHDHTEIADPVLYLQGSIDPDSDNTEFMGMWYSSADNVGYIDVGKGTINFLDSVVFPAKTVSKVIQAGSARVGASAPAWQVNDNAAGYGFDADADQVFLSFEVPDCWVASTNLTFKIYWVNEDGAGIPDTKKVKWNIGWRSIIWGTETSGNGTVATGTVTYTQSGAGADGATHVSTITLAYNDANQPISVGDSILIAFNRDVTGEGGDTYGSDAVVSSWEIDSQQNSICDHR